MVPLVPLAALVELAETYRQMLGEGFRPSRRDGGPSISEELVRRLGLSTRGVRNRLDIAAALGLDLPGWPGPSEPRADAVRLRYRTYDKTYAAWAKSQERQAAFRGEIGGPPIPEAAKPPEGFEISRNSAAYDEGGKLLRQWVGTKRAPGEAFEAPPGHAVKGVSALVDADGRVMQRWIKTREGAVGEGLVEALQGAFAAFTGAAPVPPAPESPIGSLYTVYPLADLHLGMYAWSQEVGSSYDLSIAVERARSAFRSLVAQAPASRHCTLIVLGDFFHANDASAATPRSGHRLDVDGRWPKVFRAGADLLLELADLLAQRHEEVEIVVLEGNHDPDASVALREALRLFYARTEARVRVHEGVSLFWYRRFGRCLLGATHGHTVKLPKLASVMAHDCPEDWGETHWRAWYTGHIHHERAVEEAGVRIESVNTLAGRDAYGHGGGWRAGHSLQAITYHEDAGEVSRVRVNVLTERLRLRSPARRG